MTNRKSASSPRRLSWALQSLGGSEIIVRRATPPAIACGALLRAVMSSRTSSHTCITSISHRTIEFLSPASAPAADKLCHSPA